MKFDSLPTPLGSIGCSREGWQPSPTGATCPQSQSQNASSYLRIPEMHTALLSIPPSPPAVASSLDVLQCPKVLRSLCSLELTALLACLYPPGSASRYRPVVILRLNQVLRTVLAWSHDHLPNEQCSVIMIMCARAYISDSSNGSGSLCALSTTNNEPVHSASHLDRQENLSYKSFQFLYSKAFLRTNSGSLTSFLGSRNGCQNETVWCWLCSESTSCWSQCWRQVGVIMTTDHLEVNYVNSRIDRVRV